MKAKNTINDLKVRFKDRVSFSRNELRDFYVQFEPNLKESSFLWRIYNLKSKELISQISNDRFTLSAKPIFKPEIHPLEKKLYRKIEKQFQDLNLCIWSSSILNEFMLHLPGKYITVLQVEKLSIESVYQFLKEQKTKNLFIYEGPKGWRYITEMDSPIVLIPLISKSPLQKIEEQKCVTIEKIIVDLFCDRDLFEAYRGSEFEQIVRNAFDRYAINTSKLLAYAKRRGKMDELKVYLTEKQLLNIYQ